MTTAKEANRIALAVVTLIRYLARLRPDRAALCEELEKTIRAAFALED